MASTSDESDEAIWQRQLKSPVDPQVRLEPDKWRTKQHRGGQRPSEIRICNCVFALPRTPKFFGEHEGTSGLLSPPQTPRSALRPL